LITVIGRSALTLEEGHVSCVAVVLRGSVVEYPAELVVTAKKGRPFEHKLTSCTPCFRSQMLGGSFSVVDKCHQRLV